MRFLSLTVLGLTVWSFLPSMVLASVQDKPSVVAAENMWADLAAQITGPDMTVTSVLSRPVSDPHLYEPGPAEGRMVSDATLVIANGAGYDAWMERLARTRSPAAFPVLRVQDVADWHEGDNVHLWYNISAVEAFIKAFVAACQKADPSHASAYAVRGQRLQAAVDQVKNVITTARSEVSGQPVAATEQVFTPLADRMGLRMKRQGFQLAVMNDVEPAPSEVAMFEDDIRQHRINLLIYNSQVNRPSVERLVAMAKQEGVPVLAVSETMPQGLHWQQWVSDTVEQAAGLLEVKK